MLFLIALAYWLLCLRLRVVLEASWADRQGGASLRAGACGLYARAEARLILDEKGLHLQTPASGGRRKRSKAGKLVREKLRRRLVPYLRGMLLGRRFERVTVHVRLGLHDAAETAIAAGAVHALACALLFAPDRRQNCDLRVTPDFSRPCLRADLQGIFSVQLGDIMLAAISAALRKGREGFGWKSIPLKA